MTTVLVTGGAGFIGSNYIFYFRKKYPKDRIVCIDSLTYAGNLETLSDIPDDDKFRFYQANICNRGAIEKIFTEESPDIVVNFAAESHVDKSIKNPGIFVETNILGTSVLLDASLKHDVKRYHQVSTDEVYGSLPYDKPEIKFREDTQLNPSSPYSSSKAGADMITMAYHKTFGLPISITRCSNNYGPYQFPEKLIPLMLSNAINNKQLPIYGDGLNIRDWLFVRDHCSAIDVVIRKAKPGSIYNVGGNNERSNIEIVRLILEKTKKPESLIKYVEDRKGHDRRYAIDSSKLKKDLGWMPETKFEEGIQQTMDWYLNNMQWVNHILDGSYMKLRR